MSARSPTTVQYWIYWFFVFPGNICEVDSILRGNVSLNTEWCHLIAAGLACCDRLGACALTTIDCRTRTMFAQGVTH
jgi:hypothetical protein